MTVAEIPRRLSASSALPLPAMPRRLAGKLRVFLDHAEIYKPIAYDIDAGKVWVYRRAADGLPVVERGTAVVEILSGAVSVEWVDRWPRL